MPPLTISKTSSISDVTNSAVIFRYKKYMKTAVFLATTTQIGINISNYSIKRDVLFNRDIAHIMGFIDVIPLILGPLLAGYLLDRKMFRQALFTAFLTILIAQAMITIGTSLSPPDAVLNIAGDILFMLGYSMSGPILVRFVLMWLSPEVVPMGVAIYLAAEILSQSVGYVVYRIIFTEAGLIPEVIALGLCSLSFFFACLLWYVDHLANIRDTRDSNMLIQQASIEFHRMFLLPKVVWAILVSAATTLGCIYTFELFYQRYPEAFSGIEGGTEIAEYTGAILGIFSILALPFFAKTIKVEKQKLKLFLFEQFAAIFGLSLLLFRLTWANYLIGVAILGLSQAALYLTFFILFLSIVKWEFLGMIIGIFCSVRNLMSLAVQVSQQFLDAALDINTDQEYKFRVLIGSLVLATLIIGFFISLIVFLKEKKPTKVQELQERPSEVTEPLMREGRAREAGSVLSVISGLSVQDSV